jgi:hypothetical protein
MATKSNLITAVNSFITAVVNIVNHRLSMLEVINELYPTKVTDNDVTETFTTQVNANIIYSIQIVKQGRNVRINGSYRNTGTTILPAGTQIFTFKENEFKGDTSSYLGINSRYVPFAIISPTILNPSSQSTEFSITYSAEL